MDSDVDAGGLRFNVRVFLPLIVFLALVVHLLLPRISILDDSWRVFRSLSLALVACAIVAQALSYVANGSVLRAIVASSGERVALLRATAIVMAASTVCLVAGGIVGYGAAVYEWTRRSGASRQTAAIAAWLPSVFDAAALVVVALASAVELLFGQRLPRSVAGALIVVMSFLIVSIAGSFYAIGHPDRLAALLRRIPILHKRLGPTVRDLPPRLATVANALRQRRGVEAAASAILNLLFDLVTLALIFLAAGYRISPSMLIAGYGVPLLLGRFSFLPGGIAVIEVGMTALYTALGVPPQIAVVVILTYRFISFWLPTLAGIPVAIGLQARRLKGPVTSPE